MGYCDLMLNNSFRNVFHKAITAQSAFFLMLGMAFLPLCVYANTYELESESEDIIGSINSVVVDSSVTLLDVAREHGFGYQDIKLLNPEIDTWMPEDGEIVQLPAKFILPDVPRKGIILNIPEMRLYYFPERGEGQPMKVITYPLGIGRVGWDTPYGKTSVIGKKEHPDWRPPPSILKEHEEAGDPLPAIVKAGPDNPLGDYALQLGFPMYLIHGTNKPWGIGMRVSHGCIRLYPEDIAELFNHIQLGTSVNIINHPYKVGESNGLLYFEAHPALSMTDNEDEYSFIPDDKEDETMQNKFNQAIEVVMSGIDHNGQYEIDWDMVRIVMEDLRGIPIVIGRYAPEQSTTAMDTDISASESRMTPPDDTAGMGSVH